MNTERIRNVEVYSHNEQHKIVDKEQFVKELVNNLPYKNTAIKLFFIHNPRIAGMINTDIDLLLIMAVENRERNFLTINQSINQSKIFQ
ncbi:hypothetical protein [Mannheimia sp. ZY171111]|uniref:hypothetical protein n=1 Tax=Mannheimia sp. ZY171111 TaxID=2679995 RepID=UPI001ADD808B|nr:hypothetical protein [Mannheimia sp. ZY171111]QTM01009.1 hypothetical protein GM698_05045 [Mannheimia sp. ZY171111]